MLTIWDFNNIESKNTLYHAENCMKKFYESLREQMENIIDVERYILPLTNEELNSYQDAKISYISGKRFPKKIAKDKNYRKVRDHCHYTGKYRDVAHSTCNSKFNVPNEIPVVFHKGSNDDYHFIIKDLASDVE